MSVRRVAFVGWQQLFSLSLPYVCPELIWVKSSFCIKVGGKDRGRTGQQRRPGAITAGKEVERAAKNSLSCQALLVSHGKPIAFAETGSGQT